MGKELGVTFDKQILSMVKTLRENICVPLYKNAYYLMANTLVVSFLGFLYWNIVSRYFTPSEVGLGSALVAASGLVGGLANIGMGVGLIRFLPEMEIRKELLINNSFTIVSSITLIGALIFISGAKYWSPELSFINGDFKLSLLFISFTLATTLSSLTDQPLIAARVTHFVFIKNIISNLVKLPLPVFVFSHLKGFAIFAGTGVGFIVGIAIAWYIFLPLVFKGYHPHPVFDTELTRKILPYSFANYLANLFNTAPGLIYPLMVINVLGSERNAYFYISWMMVMVLVIIPTGMAQSLLAEGSHDSQKLSQNVKRALLFAVLLAIPAISIMTYIGGWLLDFFGPGYSEQGTPVMRYLSMAIIPQCVNSLFLSVNQVRRRVKAIIFQTGVLAFLSIGLGWLLMGEYGLPGIGMAYVASHFLVAMFVIIPLLRVIKEKRK